jgi:DNA-binding SARP family transcriptional activator/tetratricopeptide (TPR) repeat protein
MKFRILGSLEVETATGERLFLGGQFEQKLLAVLLDAGGMVPMTRLVDALWDEAPPATAIKQVQNAVGRLRRLLAREDEADPILTQPGGYRFRTEAHTLDTRQFEAKVTEAEAAAMAGQASQSALLLQGALQLWRGPALSGLSGKIIEAAASVWNERRCEVQERYFEARIALGEHRQIIGDLMALVSAHPTRERPAAQLMLALYRDGRQAEALAVYQRARQVLIGELGIEPGTGLRELHQRVLAVDPALALPDPPASSLRPAVPHHLPAGLQHFIGRAEELEMLTGLLEHSGTGTPGTVVISAIGGTAGVGKTALALHWAHQVTDQFGDGQLYMNLRGFDPSGTPATPAEAIRRLLDGLGVPPERIPATLEAQAALYRSLLTERTMLIVLDNARDEAQVRPLLPASPGCLVIVTSRNQLSGLAAAHGARLLSLDVLTHGEAAQLLTARIGASRAAAGPGAIDEIAAQCAYLPLALAVTAARAAARPRFPLAELAAELRGAADRLDALDADDPTLSVRVVFSWSYRQLSEQAARMFRLLGLHPGPDISVPASASLAAVDEPQARRLLRELARDCLIIEHAPGRYAFHDLLRAYAVEMARERDSQTGRDAAIERILDHYLHTAEHSSMLLHPPREKTALAPPGVGTRPEEPADHRQALAWFVAEHQVLLTVVTFAVETGADSHAWQLPCAMMEYLSRRGYLRERVTVLTSALAAATRLGDARGQARSLRSLANACRSTGDYDQARAHLEHCLPLYQRLDDRIGEAATQQSLSILADAQGRYADAVGHGARALSLFRASGHELGEALMLNNIAWCHAHLGNYQQARAFCEQSLALIAKLGGCDFECSIWDTLGYAELFLGEFARAIAHFEYALGLCRDHGNRTTEAEILTHAGSAHHAACELTQAREAWRQALAIYDDIGHGDADKVRAKLASIEG